MLRLCSKSSRSYLGRSVRHAAFDVSFYHFGEITGRGNRFTKPRRYHESIQPDIENKTKRSYSGSVNMTHQKAAPYEATHKVIGQKSAEAILAKCLLYEGPNS